MEGGRCEVGQLLRWVSGSVVLVDAAQMSQGEEKSLLMEDGGETLESAYMVRGRSINLDVCSMIQYRTYRLSTVHKVGLINFIHYCWRLMRVLSCLMTVNVLVSWSV